MTDQKSSSGIRQELCDRLSTLGGEGVLEKFRMATRAEDVDTQIAVRLATESKHPRELSQFSG